MFRKISAMFAKTHNLKQAVSILFVTVLLSNVLGLLRDVVMANRVGVAYGSIAPLDKFYAAFVLPDLLYNILIVGALSSAILPMLVRIDAENDDHKFWSTYNQLLSTGLVIIVVGLVLLLIIMPLIIPHLFPGFSSSDISTTTTLTQVMLLSPLFFTLSQISTSALQAKKVFLAPALAPIIYNAAIIIGALLIPKFGITVLVGGVIIGAAGHFLIQLPSLISHGWRWQFKTGFKNPDIKRVAKIMLPSTVALTSTQLLLLVFFQIASKMTKGSITIYQLTDDLQTAPVLLLANTLAVAILPDFSRHFVSNELAEFKKLVTSAIRLLIFIFLPVTTFLILYRLPIISLFIAIGHNISRSQIELAALTFGWFVASLFFQGAVLILVRAYFARSDTIHPTIYSIISLVIAWLTAELLAHFSNFGVAGLSLAFSLGSLCNAYLLWRNLGFATTDIIRDNVGRKNLPTVLFGALLSWLAFWLLRLVATPFADRIFSSPSVGNLAVIILGFVGGLGVYVFWARAYNIEQWQLLQSRRRQSN